MFIIYQSIVIPFRLCFEVEASGAFYYLETVMDVSFMIDIVVTFNTGFYKKGYLVMKRKDIIMNYIKTWFILDMLASFPYSWVMTDSDNTDTTTSTGIKKATSKKVSKAP
jgi:hyperpolarization activated cyclic nucleotide-gated potassium channel 2